MKGGPNSIAKLDGGHDQIAPLDQPLATDRFADLPRGITDDVSSESAYMKIKTQMTFRSHSLGNVYYTKAYNNNSKNSLFSNM